MKRSGIVWRSWVEKFCLLAATAGVLVSADNGKKDTLIGSHQLSSQQRRILKSAGTRYEQPGKERLVLTGSLDAFTNGVKSGSSPARITIEFPDQAKIEKLDTSESAAFDGSAAKKIGGALNKQDLDVLELMTSEFTDGFFAAALRGSAMRTLGTSSKVIQAGRTVYCDLFELREPTKVRGSAQVIVRTYCFDSQSGLLRSVSQTSGGVQVESRFEDWISVDGQAVPRRLSRYEDGKQSLGFISTSVSASSKIADDIFSKP